MIDDLSALGLRHVGYGVPTEMFAPFVTPLDISKGPEGSGRVKDRSKMLRDSTHL